MQYVYFADFEIDPDGGFLVTFPDVPEAITHGETRTEALTSAREALSLALRGILQEGRDLPLPVTLIGEPVALDAEDAVKLAVIQSFKNAGISKRELARRIGKTENEARRLLDPDHRSKLGPLQDALQALGKRIVVTVLEAA